MCWNFCVCACAVIETVSQVCIFHLQYFRISSIIHNKMTNKKRPKALELLWYERNCCLFQLHMVKKVRFSEFLSWTVPNNSTDLSFLQFQNKNVSEVSRKSRVSPLSTCQCANVLDDRRRSVLGGAWQRKRDKKWQWRQQIKGRRWWTREGAYAQKVLRRADMEMEGG